MSKGEDKIIMLSEIKIEIKKLLKEAGVSSEVDLVIPPKKEMGDLALPCFELSKEMKKNPAEVANEIKNKLVALGASKDKNLSIHLLDKIEAIGPYVNFYLNPNALAEKVLKNIKKNYGINNLGEGKKIMVEFAHPNTHKAFHIGHLRNIITGESVSRLLENSGYKIIRANYQGDMGMHIPKCLWSILQIQDLKSEIKKLKTIENKVKFLGEAYVKGAQAFEEDEKAKEQIVDINKKIYFGDKEIKKLYKETRKWSLEYFDKIYKRVGTKFDRLYFESEVFERGVEIVKEFLNKGVFKESQGAIIFEGSKHGLHDRVFMNSKGLPTYEAKDLALAELQIKEKNLDEILHVVGKEQLEYFKVVFKAMEQTQPESKGKEKHLDYGWVSLKEGKMSSRKGKVVLGDWLLDEVKKKILEAMKESNIRDKKDTAEKLAQASVKYSFLKTGIKNDIKFDLNESVSLTGDSGAYLLYIIARIKSILKKSKAKNLKSKVVDFDLDINNHEKNLLLKLAEFPEVARSASEQLDPSKVAQYLFDLAQVFNNFYHECPVLKAEKKEKEFRLKLIQSVEQVMSKGLYLLGIETVGEM